MQMRQGSQAAASLKRLVASFKCLILFLSDRLDWLAEQHSGVKSSLRHPILCMM